MSPLMVSVSGVRGIVGAELNPIIVASWTAAFSRLLDPGAIVLGRDSRPSGEALAAAASSVFRSMGREVWDIGIVPTPTVQLAVERWRGAGGLILSASHNPARWNALKFVAGDGSFLPPEGFGRLCELQVAGPSGFAEATAYAGVRDRREEALRVHLDAILAAVDVERIRAAGLRAVLDTGHGAGGVLLPALATELGVVLEGRNLEPDGMFAANPEPNSETLKPLLETVPPGACFAGMVDPDADRFALALPGADAAAGAIVGEEWTLPLVARSVLAGARRPGAVLVTNLSTSTRIESAAAGFGAEVVRTPVGEAHVVGAMKARGALLGGEGNGGIIDPAVHLGRDSAVAFARLCEAEATTPGGLRSLAAELPPRHMLKQKLPAPAGGWEPVRPQLVRWLGSPDDERDGLWWRRADGFVHVRSSNTEPIVRAVVEAADAGAAEETARRLREILGAMTTS